MENIESVEINTSNMTEEELIDARNKLCTLLSTVNHEILVRRRAKHMYHPTSSN